MSSTYDNIDIRYISDGHDTSTIHEGVQHESWKVSITVNNSTCTSDHVIVNPLPPSGRQGGNDSTLLVDYIRESVRHKPAWQYATPEWQRLQQGLEAYRETLCNNVRAGLPALDKRPFRPGAVGCHINIIEDGAHEEHTIHKLAWELLEKASMPGKENDHYTIGVTRRVAYPTMRTGPAKSFKDVQQDPKATFKILLVIARNLSNPNKHDLDPDIAQYPLMKLQQQFRKEGRKSRLYVEVVRPGTLPELESHLHNRARLGVKFNLVHLDMHGKLLSPEGSDAKACFLRFGHRGGGTGTEAKPQGSLEEVSGRSIVRVLEQARIDCVVLNACFSASCMHKPVANLSRELVRCVREVSSMWHRVNHKTARLYVRAFYTHLLVDLEPFATAAHKARLVLWRDEERWNGLGRQFTDAFVCVNYQHAYQESKMLGSHNVPAVQRPSFQHSATGTNQQLATHSVAPSGGGPIDQWSSGPRLAVSTSFQSAASMSNLSSNGDPSWVSLPLPSAPGGRANPFRRRSRRFLERGEEQPSGPARAPEGDDGLALDTAPDEHCVVRMTLIILDLELALTNLRILYARKSGFGELPRAFEKSLRDAIALWLRTSMIRRVSFYQARSFEDSSNPRPYKSYRPYYSSTIIRWLDRERRPEPFAETLHIISGVDDAVTQGEAKDTIARNMGRFLERLDNPSHTTACKKDYAIFVGENDYHWWQSQWWTKSDKGEQTWHGGHWDPATFHSSLAATVRETQVPQPVVPKRQSIMNSA